MRESSEERRRSSTQSGSETNRSSTMDILLPLRKSANSASTHTSPRLSRAPSLNQRSLVSSDIGSLNLELARANLKISETGVSHRPPGRIHAGSINATTVSLLSTDVSRPRETTANEEEKKLDAESIYNARFGTSAQIPDRSATFPRFAQEELKLGPVLGVGGFGSVRELRKIEVMMDSFENLNTSSSALESSLKRQESAAISENDEVIDMEENLNRRFIAKHCQRKDKGRKGEARYAIKSLRKDVQEDPDRCLMGMADMATETRVLSTVRHPNIVKLRAIASVTPFHPEYFLVMDRLYDTLEVRIKKWKKQNKRFRGWRRRIFDRHGFRHAELWDERLAASMDLAAAMTHLHSHGIIHRDLKPQNIGFDIRGDIKIFDFGLSKEFPILRLSSNGKNHELYHFTQMVGSPRYMAEEVALGKPYNESCDTYSFALLLWQMLTLKYPYGKRCSLDNLVNTVWNGDRVRPPLHEDWSVSLKKLLFSAWHPSLKARPAMSEVREVLYQELLIDTTSGSLRSVEEQRSIEMRSDPVRRRSTFVFHEDSAVRNFFANFADAVSMRSLKRASSRSLLRSSSQSMKRVSGPRSPRSRSSSLKRSSSQSFKRSSSFKIPEDEVVMQTIEEIGDRSTSTLERGTAPTLYSNPSETDVISTMIAEG